MDQSFYGTQIASRAQPRGVYGDDAVCQYESSGDHCIQLTDMHENCMGRYVTLKYSGYHNLQLTDMYVTH